jgi:glycosyltransferase involved in cell wall biosynthesis
MKILFTSHRFFPDIGGIESHSEILAGYLASKGCGVVLSTQTPSGSTQREFPYPVLRREGAGVLRQAHRDADLVYQNNIELGSLWQGAGLRKPLVVSIHTWLRGSGGRRRPVDLLKKLVLRRANAVVCVSEALRRDTFPKALVVPNPYDDRIFRKLSGVPRDRAVVFFGRLVSDKGADLLVEAFGRLAADRELQNACARMGVAWRLTIVGSGDEGNALKTMVDNKRLSDRVEFCGAVAGEDLVSILNRHRVVAIPSRWREPFGMVALEGMACGCVPIGSDGGGLPDAIGEAGLTFPRGSIDGLVEGLRRLFLEPNLLDDLENRAALHLGRHRRDVVCAKYLEIIQYKIFKSRNFSPHRTNTGND